MAAAAELQRQEEFLVAGEPFRHNAFMIINKMDLMSTRPTMELVDEVLHSIFFLGNINTPPFTPEDILGEDGYLDVLIIKYPLPFERYSSQVPRRGPFSCVLDMVVNVIGQVNEVQIRQQLQQFVGTLRGDINKPLVSKTICVSQSNPPGSVRYYGVSIPVKNIGRRKVLIGASCLSGIWDSYVAEAVMTFYPEQSTQQGRQGFAKKPYFDGTITVPEFVRCETFDLYDGGLKPPCRSCSELFGLTTTETRVFPHGNCAEAESLSNLFKGDEAVRGQVRRAPLVGDREKAIGSVRVMFRGTMRSYAEFRGWTYEDDGFYTPEEIRP